MTDSNILIMHIHEQRHRAIEIIIVGDSCLQLITKHKEVRSITIFKCIDLV